MNVARATQTAAAAPERPGTFAGGQTRQSGPQGPRTGQRRATPTRNGQAGSPQRAVDAPDGTGVPPSATRPSVASPAASTGLSRAGAPLVLPGATLAEAFGITCPRAADIPPHLRPILPLLAAGHRRNQIAYALGVRRSCVDSRLGRLYALLGVHDRHSAVAVAREIGLLPDNPKET